MIVGGLDFETTGLLAPEHRIIEAAVILYDWDGIDSTMLESYTQRINGDRPIDAKARAIHGISESDLVGKPMWPAVAPELCAILDRADVVVAHNGIAFDFAFLVQELERISHPIPNFEPFDTLENGRWATAMGNVPNLGALCWACGIAYDANEAHAADYDVRVMMECFFYGIRRKTFIMPSIGVS